MRHACRVRVGDNLPDKIIASSFTETLHSTPPTHFTDILCYKPHHDVLIIETWKCSSLCRRASRSTSRSFPFLETMFDVDVDVYYIKYLQRPKKLCSNWIHYYCKGGYYYLYGVLWQEVVKGASQRFHWHRNNFASGCRSAAKHILLGPALGDFSTPKSYRFFEINLGLVVSTRK